MDEEEYQKNSVFDLNRYSEKTRKIIFGVVVGILLAIVGLAIFVVSPTNDRAVAMADETSSPTATQAAVNDETTGKISTPSPSTTEEATSYNGNFPKNEDEEAAIAQQKIIEKGLQEQKELMESGKEITDVHENIPNARALETLASKGMLEYCIDNPDETTEQKQARMKPYFHADNTQYQLPKSLYLIKKCSVEGITEAHHDANDNIIVYVGIAWGGQYDADGKAETGYSQYAVIVDNNGIVSFND
jgi:hypothetical protein